MRIYTRSGDLAFKTFIFPDGQPHFKLETYERDFNSVTVESSIKSPLELFQVILANDVLRNHGYSEINLDIRYLLGARMDRAISSMEPFTLQSVARIINSCGFSKVRVLDVHSEVATRLIRNSSNVLPFKVFAQVTLSAGSPAIVCPDKGAIGRVKSLAMYESAGPIIYCKKKRDMATGALSGFEVSDYQANNRPYTENVLIVDDICDGGGTFVGLAKVLKENGAQRVYLYVTHGIFSKGLPLEGIDHVYTTDSYTDGLSITNSQHRPYVNSSSQYEGFTVIPISMKDM